LGPASERRWNHGRVNETAMSETGANPDAVTVFSFIRELLRLFG